MTLVCDSDPSGSRHGNLSAARCGKQVVRVRLIPVGRPLIFR
jgi:hypothetical protein